MKTPRLSPASLLSVAILALLAHAANAQGVMTWDGGGTDADWLTVGKWTSQEASLSAEAVISTIMQASAKNQDIASAFKASVSNGSRLLLAQGGGGSSSGAAGVGGAWSFGGGSIFMDFDPGGSGVESLAATPSGTSGTVSTPVGTSEAALGFTGSAPAGYSNLLLATASVAGGAPTMGTTSFNADSASFQAASTGTDSALPSLADQLGPVTGGVGDIGGDGGLIGTSNSSGGWDGGSLIDEVWTTVENWSGDSAYPGSLDTPNSDVATFNTAIANGWGSFESPIWMDISYLGGMVFDTGAGSYHIDGDGLTLIDGGSIEILSTLSSTNAIQKIYVPFILSDGQYEFANNSANGIDAGAGTMYFYGGITNEAGGNTLLTLSGSNTNSNTIQGAILKGSSATMSVTKTGVGTWALAGQNQFNGQLTIEEGTLQVPTVNNSGGTATANGPLGRSTLPVILGKSGTTGTLEYTSVVTDATSTKRFTLAGGGSGAIQITNSGANLNLTGVIAGTGSLEKRGPGTLLLAAANTFTGTTTLSAGVLTAKYAEIAGTSGPFGNNISAGSIIFDGGILQFSSSNQHDYSSRLTTIGNKDYRIDTNAQDLTFASGLLDPGSSTSGLQKIGAGTLNLNGSSTYIGLTDIQGGALKLGATNAIKSGNAVTIRNVTAGQTSTLDLNGNDQTIGGAGLTLGGYNADNTAQVIGAGKLTLSGGATALTYSEQNNPLGALISTTYVDLAGVSQVFTIGDSTSASNDLTISSVIQNGTLTKAGAGTMTLTGANSYVGNTTISGGTLKLGVGGVGGSLNSNSNIVNNSNLTIDRSNSTPQGTDFGLISGTGSVSITGGTGGTGVTTLNLGNTYQGGTTVSGGTLVVNNTSGSGTGTGSVLIAYGATLKGNGTLSGDVTVNGTHAPGNSPGVETIGGSLDYGALSVFEWELTSNTEIQGASPDFTFDQVVMTGDTLSVSSGAKIRLIFNLPSESSVDFADAFWNVDHSWDVFTGFDTFSGVNFVFDTISTDSTGTSYLVNHPYGSFGMNQGTLTWTAVPEPTSAVAGILIGAGLLRRRRRVV